MPSFSNALGRSYTLASPISDLRSPTTVSQHAYVSGRYSVALADDSIRFGRCPNSRHVIVCQLALGVTLALISGCVRLPALAASVQHVVRIGRKKKMIWAHARRIVAFVADAPSVMVKFIWINTSERHLVGHAVSAQDSVGHSKCAVALRILGCGPIPAIVGLVNLVPKSLREIWKTRFTGTTARAKALANSDILSAAERAHIHRLNFIALGGVRAGLF